ncbi:MAG: DUF1194 domain-containing protein [Rhodobacteraceae bacterium]|nr:DUF1194 domain-containing protein [Paracoccaceae bacterium]
MMYLLPASACPLALVIAMDGSSSVNSEEHEMQVAGLAEALRDDDVVEAIQAVGGIWFSSFEWSGRSQQSIQVGWRFLEDREGIEKAAERLQRSVRGFTQYPTALGYALGFAAVHLKQVPEFCVRQVIDVAGDGINNEGFSPQIAYGAFPFQDVTVNALAIAGAKPDPVHYYQNEVIRGPGSFVEVAQGFQDYAAAMKRKLLREVGTSYSVNLDPALAPAMPKMTTLEY